MNTKDTLLDILNDIDDSIDWKEQKGLWMNVSWILSV